tara:strand:+ start:2000 stop:2173 length:174 start_codon:yes stop_codon:yes gene_type:complete
MSYPAADSDMSSANKPIRWLHLYRLFRFGAIVNFALGHCQILLAIQGFSFCMPVSAP